MDKSERRERKMRLALIISTFCCLLAGIVFTVSASTQVEKDKPTAAVQPDAGKSLDAEYAKLLQIVKAKRSPVQKIDGSLGVADRPGIGPKDADVILVEFGDFQCPFCKRHLLGAAQKIQEQLVATKQLRYVFLDFPMTAEHPLAAKAAAAARCAEEQGKYWEMRNILYNNQKALHELFLVEHAKSAGMDETVFNSCLQSGRHDTAIQQDQAVGKSLGINGTPTFFLGINDGDEITLIRKIQGAQPYEVFEREIVHAIDMAKIQRGIQDHSSRTDY